MERAEKLGTKQICDLVKDLRTGKSVEKLKAECIEIDGKPYYYEKTGNSVFIWNDNKQAVKVTLTDGEDITTVVAEYFLENGTHLTVEKSIFDKDAEFKEIDLANESIRYIDHMGRQQATAQVPLDTLCLEGDATIYEFTPEGVKYNNRLASHDGNVLLSIHGNPVPRRNEYLTFDKKKQKDILDLIIEDNPTSLHAYTKALIIKAQGDLDKIDRDITKYEEYYTKDVKQVRAAIAIRNYMASAVDSLIISPDALAQVENRFRERMTELTTGKQQGPVKAKTTKEQ